MDCIRFKIGGLIIATTALASLVAPPWFVIVVVGWIAFLLVTLSPATSRWQNGEFAATVTWLLGAILAFSNVMVDGLTFMFLLIVGVVISISWSVREVYGESKSSSIIEWPTLLFVPTSLLLVVALAVTDMDLRLRLALSESAFRADVRRIALGHKEKLTRQERRVGLFWVVMSKRSKVASSGRREDSSWTITAWPTAGTGCPHTPPMSFATSVGLGGRSSSTSERCRPMGKPARLPTAGEINVHDTLDEREIVKHFLGKNLQEAESHFRNSYGLMEELLWMGPKAFCFYVAAAIGYLHNPESEGN